MVRRLGKRKRRPKYLSEEEESKLQRVKTILVINAEDYVKLCSSKNVHEERAWLKRMVNILFRDFQEKFSS